MMMRDSPKVSVVMSVYKNADHVQKTMQSVLAQQGVELEFIVVSDGATQEVLNVLKGYDNDNRVVVHHQSNMGLTRALINGCAIASYPFIARIDAGDLMVTGRLLAQAQLLKSKPNVGLVSSWVSMVTDETYKLYELKLSQTELQQGLMATQSEQFRSPFHASVMFDKAVYLKVGGYRPEFYFTQDCDLWSRMIEHSEIDVIEEVLTVALCSLNGISGQYAAQQRELIQLVIKAKQYRLKSMSEHEVLEQARHYGRNNHNEQKNKSAFETLYFLAKCLSDRRSQHAREYWLKVIKVKPWSVKSWFFLMQAMFVKSSAESQ